MIGISKVTRSEIKELYSVFCDWGEEYKFDYEIFKRSFNLIMSSNENMVIVAKENEKIVGFIQIIKCVQLGLEPYYEIAELLVKKSERQRGIGEKLLLEIERIAKNDKIKMIKLCSEERRINAHKFYEKNGYTYFKISKFYEKKLK